jgi:hypothetical protein
MEKFEYIGFNLLFSIIPAFIVFFRHRKHVVKHISFIFISSCIGILWAILDIFGAGWGAWEYTPEKNIGIHFGKATLETFMWGAILFAIFGAIIVIFAEKEEKKKPFWPFL